MHDRKREKQAAAIRAVDYIQPDMIVGLGTGTTMHYVLLEISERLKSGHLTNILGIPSSLVTEQKAQALSIPLTTFEEHPEIDLTIDGADEVDQQLHLIKGGGGALLREKILIQASHHTVIVVDEGKLSPKLGTIQPVPVEVLPFAKNPVSKFIMKLDADVIIRKGNNGENIETDQGNWLLDCYFGAIDDPHMIAYSLDKQAGIIEHGLFLDTGAEVIVASGNGIRYLSR